MNDYATTTSHIALKGFFDAHQSASELSSIIEHDAQAAGYGRSARGTMLWVMRLILRFLSRNGAWGVEPRHTSRKSRVGTNRAGRRMQTSIASLSTVPLARMTHVFFKLLPAYVRTHRQCVEWMSRISVEGRVYVYGFIFWSSRKAREAILTRSGFMGRPYIRVPAVMAAGLSGQQLPPD